jgi:hypothetical protein
MKHQSFQTSQEFQCRSYDYSFANVPAIDLFHDRSAGVVVKVEVMVFDAGGVLIVWVSNDAKDTDLR